VLQSVAELPGVTIVDQSPRMLQVDGDVEVLKSFVQSAQNIVLLPERTYSLPNPRHKVRHT